jgi:hypothetical protein
MSASISVQSPHLHENGPIYTVVITPSFVTIEALKLEKKDVPYIKVQALFDTGAQTTAISEKVADFLKLDSNIYLNALCALSADLQDHSIDCLIGRDVLQHGVFTYDGPRKSFRWTFE